MEPTRLCQRCYGSQMLVISARNGVSPKNAFAYIALHGMAIRWIVWCSCKEESLGSLSQRMAEGSDQPQEDSSSASGAEYPLDQSGDSSLHEEK